VDYPQPVDTGVFSNPEQRYTSRQILIDHAAVSSPLPLPSTKHFVPGGIRRPVLPPPHTTHDSRAPDAPPPPP
jgi:hypothetical protein